MTLPIDKAGADVYTDFGGLTALKKSVRNNDPDAVRQVAKQYESLFARMMIKSMRDAVGKDPLFGSDQEQSYQEMYDDQLSIELTKGKGLGLADMLVRQMQRLTGSDKADSKADPTGSNAASEATDPKGAHPAASAAATVPQAENKAGLRLFKENSPYSGQAPGHAASAPVTPEAQSSFISDLWPAAQQAGQQLGIDPRNLIAQAALETNWGTRVPLDASGRSSNNLFGMKAGGQWNGASVTTGTQEYENGAPVTTTGQFRAYDNRAQSFQDYVSLLRNSPRYAAALNTGSNSHAFATALQRGGYATDPDYANKVSSIASSIGSHLATLEPALKSASARPINPLSGIL
jgi:flagellar protein FlgJ